MHSSDNNSVEDLSELLVFAEGDELASAKVFADLRISTTEIEVDGHVFSLGLRQAFLKVALEGCSILPGSRIADSPVEAISQTTTLEQNTQFAVSKSGPQLNFGSSSGTSSTNAYRQVRSRPGNSWIIESNNPSDRDATIDCTVFSNSHIFSARSKSGSNRTKITSSLTAKRRDVVATLIEGKASSSKCRTNTERVVGILLARSIGTTSQNPRGSESVHFSESEMLEE